MVYFYMLNMLCYYVYVLTKKQIFESDAHRICLFLFICSVMCLPSFVIIPVLHIQYVLLAFLMEQVWTKGEQQLFVHTVHRSTLCVVFSFWKKMLLD